MASRIIFPEGPLPPHYLTDNRSQVVYAVVITFIVFELVAFALRMTARQMRHVSFGWDDALIIPALLCNLTLCAMSLGKSTTFL